MSWLLCAASAVWRRAVWWSSTAPSLRRRAILELARDRQEPERLQSDDGYLAILQPRRPQDGRRIVEALVPEAPAGGS